MHVDTIVARTTTAAISFLFLASSLGAHEIPAAGSCVRHVRVSFSATSRTPLVHACYADPFTQREGQGC